MTAVPQMQLTYIALSNLIVDHCNPRTDLDTKKVDELAKQLKSRGIIEPLIVRAVTPEGAKPVEGVVSLKFSVLCGSRRLAAAHKAELDSVPCIIRRPENDAEAREIAITEQDSIATLHYLERAEAYRKWKDDGISVTEIASKTHQLKSAVSMIIALNDLTPEVKRACHDGKLYEDTARALATMPPQTHGEILKELLKPGPDGKPKNTRECREAIASYRLDLMKAPFDPKDETLHCLTHKAACTSCPYRSGTQPDLYGDTKNEWLCMFREGYAKKADLQWLRLVEEGAGGKGIECLTPKQTDSYFDPAGNLKDDAPYVAALAICYEDEPQRTNGELVPKVKESFFYAKHPKTFAAVKLIGKSKLNALLEEAGKIRRAKPAAAAAGPSSKALSAEALKKKEEKVRRRQLAIRRLIGAVNAKLAKREPDRKWYRIQAESLIAQGVLRHTLKRRDVQGDPMKYLDRLTSEGDLRQFVFEGTMEHELYGEAGSDKYPPRLLEVAKLAGVDMLDVEKEIVAEERAQPAVKKADEKPLNAKPKPVAKTVAKTVTGFDTKPRPAPKPGAKKVTPKAKKKQK